MNQHTARSQILTETLTYEMTKALALPQTENIKKLIASLTGRAIQRFTELAVEQEGIAGGACWLLSRLVAEHAAHGVENIPPVGPLDSLRVSPLGI